MREFIKPLILRILLLLVIIVIWEYIVNIGFISKFWVSKPSLIANRMIKLFASGEAMRHISATFKEMIFGYVLGAIAGFFAGFMFGRWKIFEVLDPFFVFLYSLPKVIIAPLLIIWLGIGIESKVALVFIAVFFIIWLNTYAGVKNVDVNLLNMLKVMGAGESYILANVVFPTAFSFIIAGLRLSVGMALMVAVVSEYIGSNVGLGYYVDWRASMFDTTGIFVGLIIVGVLSVTISEILRQVEKRVLRWRPEVFVK